MLSTEQINNKINNRCLQEALLADGVCGQMAAEVREVSGTQRIRSSKSDSWGTMVHWGADSLMGSNVHGSESRWSWSTSRKPDTNTSRGHSCEGPGAAAHLHGAWAAAANANANSLVWLITVRRSWGHKKTQRHSGLLSLKLSRFAPTHWCDLWPLTPPAAL